jgi:hypothetical protein
MSKQNFLVMIIDTSPILWSHLNRVNSDAKFIDYLNACVGFLNAYMAMSQQNACALIASHHKKA